MPRSVLLTPLGGVCYRSARAALRGEWMRTPGLGALVTRLIQMMVVLALALSMIGCGPIVSGMRIMKADVEISEAVTAGARDHAVYEYTAALEYLKKAREEHAYSDFVGAERFAAKALDYAYQARRKAEVGSRVQGDGHIAPTETSDEKAVIIVPAPQSSDGVTP